jgi:peptide chain release factor 1
VTDHRAGITLYKLDSILQGQLEELLDGLSVYFNTQQLQSLDAGHAQ